MHWAYTVATLGLHRLYWGYTGVRLVLYWGYEATLGLHWGYTGAIQGLYPNPPTLVHCDIAKPSAPKTLKALKIYDVLTRPCSLMNVFVVCSLCVAGIQTSQAKTPALINLPCISCRSEVS